MSEDRLHHDVANQLSIVLGFAELLLAETPVDAPRRRDLQAIYDAAAKALRILMAARRPGAGPTT